MAVNDPVCGMEIDPKTAFATREHMGETFYFCSQACVDKFDADPHRFAAASQAQHTHDIEPPNEKALAGSVTTGFNPALPLSSIELPIIGLKDGGRQNLETALNALPGVRAAKVNPAGGIVRIEYDAQATSLVAIENAVKSAGYRVGGSQTRIGISNLFCSSCATFIEDDLKTLPGVLDASVNIGTQEVTVNYLPERAKLDQFNEAIRSWGYQVHPSTTDQPEDRQRLEHEREYRRLMNRFWFAAILSIPILIFAYYQFFPIIRDLNMQIIRLAWGASALLALPVLFYSGSDFFTGAWAALKHRSANMNTLIALGTGAAWLYSTVAILFPGIFPEGTSRTLL